MVPGRKSKQCRERYFYSLAPHAGRGRPWTESEDRKLFLAWTLYGNDWKKIATYFSERKNRRVKNRFNVFIKKHLSLFKDELESARKMFLNDYDKFSATFIEIEKQLFLANFERIRGIPETCAPGRPPKAPRIGPFGPKDGQYLSLIVDSFVPNCAQRVLLNGNTQFPEIQVSLDTLEQVELWLTMVHQNKLCLGQLKTLHKTVDSVIVQHCWHQTKRNFSFMDNWSETPEFAHSTDVDQDKSANTGRLHPLNQRFHSHQELPSLDLQGPDEQARSVDFVLGKRAHDSVFCNSKNGEVCEHKKQISNSESRRPIAEGCGVEFGRMSQSFELFLKSVDQEREYRSRLEKLYLIRRRLFQNLKPKVATANETRNREYSEDSRDPKETSFLGSLKNRMSFTDFTPKDPHLISDLCSFNSEIKNESLKNQNNSKLFRDALKTLKFTQNNDQNFLLEAKNYIEPDFDLTDNEKDFFKENFSIKLALSQMSFKQETRACTSPDPNYFGESGGHLNTCQRTLDPGTLQKSPEQLSEKNPNQVSQISKIECVISGVCKNSG